MTGWSEPAGAVVPAIPAAMPATWVPWKEDLRSRARSLFSSCTAPGKERATITFGVVHFVPPFGKPAGYRKPAGLKNRCLASTPSSITPIFTPAPSPLPVARSACRADDRGAEVEGERVAVARVDLRGRGEPGHARQGARRHARGEAVQEHAVAPGHRRLRHGSPELRARPRAARRRGCAGRPSRSSSRRSGVRPRYGPRAGGARRPAAAPRSVHDHGDAALSPRGAGTLIVPARTRGTSTSPNVAPHRAGRRPTRVVAHTEVAATAARRRERPKGCAA